MAEETQSSKVSGSERGRSQRKVGLVISDGMEKSVRVAVERLVAHARYGKRIRRTSIFMAHDESNECRVGDKVEIIEARPLSKRKRWRVTEVLERAVGTTAAGQSS